MIGAVSPATRAMPRIEEVRIRHGIGQHVLANRLPLARAERERAFAQTLAAPRAAILRSR